MISTFTPIYCCKGLRSNLNNKCKDHGWSCPDHLIYFKEESGQFRIPCDHGETDGGFFWEITHCPFCGKRLEIEKSPSRANT